MFCIIAVVVYREFIQESWVEYIIYNQKGMDFVIHANLRIQEYYFLRLRF